MTAGPKLVGFSDQQATRIANAVVKIEGLPGGGPAPAAFRYAPGTTAIVKGKLTAAVTQDSSLPVASQKGTFTPWLPSDPFDNTSADAASSDYAAIDIWPWGLADKTTIASGTEIIAGYCNGRWYVIDYPVSTPAINFFGSGTLNSSGTTTPFGSADSGYPADFTFSSSTVTINTAGTYLITGHCVGTSSTTTQFSPPHTGIDNGSCELDIRNNGTNIVTGQAACPLVVIYDETSANFAAGGIDPSTLPDYSSPSDYLTPSDDSSGIRTNLIIGMGGSLVAGNFSGTVAIQKITTLAVNDVISCKVFCTSSTLTGGYTGNCSLLKLG